MSNQDVNALGYFFAASPNLPLRQKLALAMMARNKKFPTNLGEGIASIGQEIGDTLAYRSMMDEDKAAAQAAATATVPPIADSAVPPTPPPQASVIPENRLDIVPPQPPQARVTAPPVPGTPGTPLPPDQQQTYEPNAITRMPGRPAPPPAIPPGQPGNTGATTFLPPGPLSTPVMAQGDVPAEIPPAEEARRAIAHAELRRQMGGASPPAPAGTPPAPAVEPPRPSVGDYGQPSVLAATPPQAIPAAPPQQPVRAIPPQQGPAQPEAIPGFVPPQPGTPQGAPTIPPSLREQQLNAFLAANSGNPHMVNSRPARELQVLTQERERKQKEADKLFEAQVARDTKQTELRTTGQMTQQERIDKAERDRLELRALPEKLKQEAAKRQQELVGDGASQQGPDPYIGTPQSRQRSGRPEIDPAPKGAIPEVWVKDQQAKVAKTAETLDSAKPELSEALNLINKARTHPSKEASLGTAGGLARLTASGQGFAAIMDQLKGKTFLSGYQKLKGTGTVSEIEGLKTEQAQARLATAQTQKDFDDALQDLETSLRGGVERVERKMNRPVTAYQKTPDDPYAPDIGEKRGGFEYIGGDPADKRNWKRAQ